MYRLRASESRNLSPNPVSYTKEESNGFCSQLIFCMTLSLVYCMTAASKLHKSSVLTLENALALYLVISAVSLLSALSRSRQGFRRGRRSLGSLCRTLYLGEGLLALIASFNEIRHVFGRSIRIIVSVVNRAPSISFIVLTETFSLDRGL